MCNLEFELECLEVIPFRPILCYILNMDNKIKIAFDLDGVIIDKPPLIPKKLLEYLFRGNTDVNNLHYRYPKTKLEIVIRKISHFYLFRPPIKQNIDYIKNLAKNSKYELYIVSARYSFLKNETAYWLKKRGINHLFKKVVINLENKQPHLYKEELLKEIGPIVFVDDDWLLADYLVAKKIHTKIYCLPGRNSGICIKAKPIKQLTEMSL